MPKILLNKSNVDLDYPICRPSLDLDFTQEVLDERITFSRGSIGTRLNRNRLIETVDANQPRFDYDPVTGECKGLLIEESRQNLLTYSEDISQLNYSVSGNSYSLNTQETASPVGDYTADKFIETTSNTSQVIINISSTNVAENSTLTFSIFVKPFGNRTNIRITLQSSTTSNFIRSHINLITKTIQNTGQFGTATYSTSGIIEYPNGWYRIYITGTLGTTTSNINGRGWVQAVSSFPSIASGGSRVGDGTSGVYVWGFQLETGEFPTSYIPTVASTVTRSADIAEMTGTNFSSWFNQTEGTLYASINNITTRSSLTFDRFVVLSGTDVNRDGISIFTQTASGGGAQNKFLPSIAYSPDGNYVVNVSIPTTTSIAGPDRIGRAIISYKQDNFAFTVNGLTPSRGISGNLPICNRLLIFRPARFQPAPSGTISRLTYYPRALKPNQLQLLTQ